MDYHKMVVIAHDDDWCVFQCKECGRLLAYTYKDRKMKTLMIGDETVGHVASTMEGLDLNVEIDDRLEVFRKFLEGLE